MQEAGDDQERLVHCDHAFHSTVFEATGNRTLTSVLEGLSSRTFRARVWRGVIEGDASQQTIREHRAIHQALEAHDSTLAEAAALMHVTTSERWLRGVLARRREVDQ
jgi:GntR family transcriptional regulator, transcriptional repressor for pyruvate dehydrogenase complex